MIFRPATPGFLVTLTATILLAVVSFSVPWFKSVFFLKAVVTLNGQNGTATFGVLGYCLDIGGKPNCTSPQVGYEFDPNSLLDNKTPIKIPQVIVKWLTYALVLHIVALAFAAGSAIFGLLAHIREMSMACCSTCISGLGAAITLLAFIFDIAFFFLVKARINAIPGGSAQIGNAIWLTLAAWVLLFLAGCFYGFGRYCISNRPRGPRDKKTDPPYPGSNGLEAGKMEALRLDAVKAEADRKARQKQGEVGLPAFQEYDPTRPLTAKGYEDEEEIYSDHQPQPPRRQASPYTNNQTGHVSNSYQGYAPAAPGMSAMDAYYNAPVQSSSPQPPPAVAGYPPQPQSHAQYPSTQYSTYGNPEANNGQYLSTAYGAYGHNQYPSNVAHEGSYGHPGQESTYYSAISHHQQPSHYVELPYNSGGQASSGSSIAYPSSGTLPSSVPASNASGYSPTNYLPPTASQFTATGAPGSIGRDDYSFAKVPQPAQPPAVGAAAGTSYLAYANISTPNPHGEASPTSPTQRHNLAPRGPRSPVSNSHYSEQSHQGSPPGYDAGEGHSSTPWPNEKQ